MNMARFHSFRFMLTFLYVGIPTFLSASAGAQDNNTKSFLNIQEVTSESGIKAWLVEDHAVPVIAMEYVFRDTGSKTDPAEKQGLARLASNTMDEGAGEIKSQEFQKELQDLSITLRFNVTRDNFGGSLKTLTKNKDRAFVLLGTALASPRFDQEPLDRMRAANLSRIKSSVADPEWMAARIQNDRIFEAHPYALNSGGTLTSLGKITAQDLKAFHKKLGKSQLVIAVAGDITAEELKIQIDKIFGALPDTENIKQDKTTLTNAGKTYLYKKDIPQTVIEITQKGISRQDDDYHAAQMMNFILGGSGFGSRLTEEIREKRGLTYGIYSYFREYEAAEILHVSTSTANENVTALIGLVHDEWKKIAETPVSDKELQDAKAYLIGSLPLSLTSTDSIAELLLSLQIDNLPIDYLDKRQVRLYAITADDIQKTAQRLLDSKTFTTILVGNPQGFENAETISALPNVE